MRIAILGGGAMGSLFAGLVSTTAHDATLIDTSRAHVRAAREGLRIVDPDGRERSIPVDATTDPDGVEGVDLLVVCVKSYDTDAAMADAPVGAETDVLTLQNGLGNPEAIAEHVSRERVIAGTTAHGAALVGDGRVRHAGAGPTRIGRYFAPNDGRVVAAADALTAAGVDTRVTETVRDAVWEKVAVNAGVNAATALARVDNGALADTDAGERLVERAVAEAARVARAEGRSVPGDVADRAREVARGTASNVSSMRRDVEAGRPTEIESLNGEIAAHAADHGVDAPVNRTLADLVRLAERG